MVTVIGRGHSGTRAISHTLSASGFYMGSELNGSGDLVPPGEFYAACRIVGQHVRSLGLWQWDFSKLQSMDIDPEFIRLVRSYLESVLESGVENRGWKLPETVLVFPWIVRMFPDIYYIHWVRDPRDNILGEHVTDDMERFGIPHEPTEDVRTLRATSWKYQTEIYRATPKPRNLIEMRFEDFVLRQEESLGRLEAFLGVPMARIEVRPEAVGRWRREPGPHDFGFLADDLARYGYTSA